MQVTVDEKVLTAASAYKKARCALGKEIPSVARSRRCGVR